MTNASRPSSNTTCPSCGEAIELGTVLCIACGFHLGLGKRLQSTVERGGLANDQPRETNPYAPTLIADSAVQGVMDLTDLGASKATKVVGAAGFVYTSLALSVFCCFPL
jgi:hypothetical protein